METAPPCPSAPPGDEARGAEQPPSAGGMWGAGL